MADQQVRNPGLPEPGQHTGKGFDIRDTPEPAGGTADTKRCMAGHRLVSPHLVHGQQAGDKIL